MVGGMAGQPWSPFPFCSLTFQTRTPAPRMGYCDDHGSFPLFTSVGAPFILLICQVVCPLISGIFHQNFPFFISFYC